MTAVATGTPPQQRGAPVPAGRILARVGAGILVVLVVVAVAAPWLAPYAPDARVGVPFSPPSAAHLLGTNDVGQDLFSVLIHGTRVSLLVGAVAAAAATLVGTAVGLTAGYLGGWMDTIAMRAVDVVLSLPFLPLMIVVGVFLGPGITTEMLVIAVVMWAAPARELRAQVLSVRERDHVRSAVSMGATHTRVLARHVLPEVVPLVVPQFVLATKRAIMFEAALSFLGLGAVTTASWGTMLFHAQARSAFLTGAWLWWVVPPGLAIAVAVVAFAFIGYGVEERARPGLALAGVSSGSRSRMRDEDTPEVGRDPGRLSADTATSGRHEPAPPLRLTGLDVVYDTPDGPSVAVDGVDLTVERGRTVGLVGGSGCGKSTLVTAAMGLLRPPARLTAGTVRVQGRDLATLDATTRRRLRGRQVALVPQQAMNALNPVMRVGDQIAEAITLHWQVDRGEVRRRVAELLEQVGIEPHRARDYPHEFSGGMRQRAVIAMALANEPDLLIADEPSSGLDVVVQVELLDLLARLRDEMGLALLVVSHDLPVVLALADRLAVMRAGRIVEEGEAGTLATDPAHPYTRSLLDAVPRLKTGVPTSENPGRIATW